MRADFLNGAFATRVFMPSVMWRVKGYCSGCSAACQWILFSVSSRARQRNSVLGLWLRVRGGGAGLDPAGNEDGVKSGFHQFHAGSYGTETRTKGCTATRTLVRILCPMIRRNAPREARTPDLEVNSLTL